MTVRATKKKPRRQPSIRGEPWLEGGETEPQGLGADQITLWMNQPLSDANVRELPKEFDNLILSTGLERSIAASSQVTMRLRDPSRTLFKAGYFSKDGRPDLLLDGLWFRAVLFEKTQADEFSIQFEDREIAIAREYKTPFTFTAHGQPNPRASFIKELLRKAAPHAPFYCPDLLKEQARVKSSYTSKKRKKKGNELGPKARAELKRAQEIKHSYTIEGQKADGQQRQNIETLLGVCEDLKAPPICYVAIICAGIGESGLHSDGPNNLNSLGYWGVLQGSSGKGKGPAYWPNRYDSKGMAEAFLKGGKGFKSAIQLVKEGVTDPGEIATKVEGSGEPANFYGKFRGEAEAIVKEWQGGSHSGSTSSTGITERFHHGSPQTVFKFPKSEAKEGEQAEGAWECAVATAEELKWRLFSRAGRFYLVSDDHLKKTHATVIEEGATGVVDVKWSVDLASTKKNPPRLEVQARAGLWQVPPGEAVRFSGLREGRDIHEGIWIVADVNRPEISDRAISITLERPEEPLAEAAPALNAPASQVVSAAFPGGPAPGPPRGDGGPTPQPAGPSLQISAASIYKWEQNLATQFPQTKPRVRWVVSRILAGWEGYLNTPKKLYITATTNGNHATHSLHYTGEAYDIASHDFAFMDTVGAWVDQYLKVYLTEGIHNPTLSVWGGHHQDPVSFWGAGVWAEHRNHIHIGVKENPNIETSKHTGGGFGGPGIFGG